MASEFEQLLKLAERNTDDIQRMSLTRKRFAGSIPGLDDCREREAREKRRRLELETRLQQREQEEKQRQQATLERRCKERIEAERVEENRRKQKQQQQQLQQAKPASLRNQGTRATDRQGTGSVAASAGSHVPRPNADMGTKRASVAAAAAVQSMSYDQLMQIASGKKPAPVRPVAEKSLKQAMQPPLSAGSSRSTASRDSQLISRRVAERSGSPRRVTRPKSPAEGRKPTLSAKPASSSRLPTGLTRTSASAARAGKQSASSDQRRDTVARKLPSGAAAAGSARPRERAGQPGTGVSARSNAQEPQRVVRRPPEREIDRFGVRPGSSTAARKEPLTRGVSRPAGTDPTRKERLAPGHPSGIRDTRDVRRPGNTRQSHSTDPRSAYFRSSRPAAPSNTRNGPARNRPHSVQPASRGSTVDRSFKQKAGGASRQRYEDDDEDDSEYNSMDDFIVDDEEEGGDRYRVGSIREMFGVRYRDVNDDEDDDMEVSASQLMREDRISAKIGRMEDEEEERMLEQAERERKRRLREREQRGR
ncbi:hypothetical protein H4R99_001372 [Coemansia sp. RSA 1722]|nr:hypothetical protein IWW45_004690 [Coemansia sp. RSA 485]KAJ2605138.1 hypothetical protein H4R99_001372 [Coemansia sp. RSA 1722]